MENENELDINSQNDAIDDIKDIDDIDVLKEKYQGLGEKHKKIFDTNKQLFARAKKAEGFELKDGKWIKPEPKIDKKPEPKKSDEDFGLLELTFLKGEDIKSEDEIEFVKKELKEAGLTNDQLPKLFANKYFKSQLDEFKTEKANVKAVAGIKGGRGGESEAKNTPEYWIAKGVPPTPEQVPDRQTRVKIARAMMNNEKSGKKFYNE